MCHENFYEVSGERPKTKQKTTECNTLSLCQLVFILIYFNALSFKLRFINYAFFVKKINNSQTELQFSTAIYPFSIQMLSIRISNLFAWYFTILLGT